MTSLVNLRTADKKVGIKHTNTLDTRNTTETQKCDLDHGAHIWPSFPLCFGHFSCLSQPHTSSDEVFKPCENIYAKVITIRYTIVTVGTLSCSMCKWQLLFFIGGGRDLEGTGVSQAAPATSTASLSVYPSCDAPPDISFATFNTPFTMAGLKVHTTTVRGCANIT